MPSLESAYVSIRQQTPAYASIRQQTPAYVSSRERIRQHTPCLHLGSN